jgi:hypothetical protein
MRRRGLERRAEGLAKGVKLADKEGVIQWTINGHLIVIRLTINSYSMVLQLLLNSWPTVKKHSSIEK